MAGLLFTLSRLMLPTVVAGLSSFSLAVGAIVCSSFAQERDVHSGHDGGKNGLALSRAIALLDHSLARSWAHGPILAVDEKFTPAIR